MKHILTAIATLIPLVMALSGCGQKGPLYLPQKEVPQKEVPQTQQKMPQPQVSPQGPENGNAEQEQNEDEEQS